MLRIRTTWYEEGYTFALWEPASLRIIQESYPLFQEQLELFISSYCTHVKEHGGLKEAVRSVYQMVQQLPYIASFDIRHYYQSIDHKVCLNLLKSAGIPADFHELVQDFLALPDKERKGTGMVAGCTLSRVHPILMANCSRYTSCSAQ